MSDKYEHLTDAELAGEVYVAIVRPDDQLSDSDMELFRPAWEMASALWERLRGPYCQSEGCPLEHMPSFPWCPWHRPPNHAPLPPDAHPSVARPAPRSVASGTSRGRRVDQNQ